MRGDVIALPQALGILERAAEQKDWDRYRIAVLVTARILVTDGMIERGHDLVKEVWDGVMRSGDTEAIAYGEAILHGGAPAPRSHNFAQIVEAVQLGALECI